jgi:hypothetical protein
VEIVMMDLKWLELSDAFELVGRYNSGFGHHDQLKTMPVDSKLNWSAYNEIVAASQGKFLELFAKVGAQLNIDLN